jgi:hypothetical protein
MQRFWRAANRKALRPQSTHQAKIVMWHLMYRVPLHFVALPEAKSFELPSLPVAAATGISFVSPKNEVVVLLINGCEPASLETLFERRLHQLIARQFLRLR